MTPTVYRDMKKVDNFFEQQVHSFLITIFYQDGEPQHDYDLFYF